jgi:hypothetical protein
MDAEHVQLIHYNRSKTLRERGQNKTTRAYCDVPAPMTERKKYQIRHVASTVIGECW